MIIDLNKYRRAIKPLVKLQFDRNPDREMDYNITVASNNTTCHLVAVCYYVGELYGYSEELAKITARHEKYYHYPEVINKELP